MIDRIEIGPEDAGDRDTQQVNTRIVLYGQLAAVMALAESKNTIDKKGRLSCVAGAGNQRYLQLSEAWL